MYTPGKSLRDASIKGQGCVLTKSLCHQFLISCPHMYACEPACLFPPLCRNPAGSVNRLRIVKEEGKLGDATQWTIHLLSEGAVQSYKDLLYSTA